MTGGVAMVLVSLCLTLAGCSKNDKNSGQQAAASGTKGEQASPSSNPGTVTILTADQRRAGISVAVVETRTVPRLLTLPGQVAMDQQHTSHIGALADGRITEVFVLPGAQVHRGTVLAQLHSHLVHETVGALVQAYAAADHQRGAVVFAQQMVERYDHLYQIQAASLEEKQNAGQTLLQANNALADAQASVHMEREHLSELLQVSPESLVPGHLYDRELVPIRSPIDGVVVMRNVTVGQVVDTGSEAFAVSDLSTVWVMASLSEKDLSLVHNGAAADVVNDGYSDLAFPAHVGMVGDVLDPATRTVPLRVVVKNAGLRLRPGMFATVHVAGQQTRTAIFAPEDALQDINGNQVVFVTTDGSNFRAQTVKIGTRSQGRAEILEGLKPGDRIVVNGAFMVKSELLKSTMGDG